MSSRSVATFGVFTALVAGLGYALSGIPNVELMNLTTFLSGAALGVGAGALVGGLAMAVYSTFNPYGAAPPPVFATQIVGLALTGVLGGALARFLLGFSRPRAWQFLVGGAIGFGVTLLYDVLTNLGTAWSMGAYRNPLPVLKAGLLFGIWHVVWNTILFAICLAPLLAILRRRRKASL
jgi:hypothetical protein